MVARQKAATFGAVKERAQAKQTIRMIEGQNKMPRIFMILIAMFVLPNVSSAAEGKAAEAKAPEAKATEAAKAVEAKPAEAKGVRFWNLTAATITSLQLSPVAKKEQLSPVGKKEWGLNQCDNDKDHTVDHDERLNITGVEPGVYNVKFRDNLHRECVLKNIDIKDNKVFSIEEKKLVGFCTMF